MQPMGAPLPAFLGDEKRLPPFYGQCMQYCGGGQGRLPHTPTVYNLLLTSGLPRDTLGHIWSLVNRTYPGQLTRAEFYAALALVALAQIGKPVGVQSVLSAADLRVPILRGPGFGDVSNGGDKPSDEDDDVPSVEIVDHSRPSQLYETVKQLQASWPLEPAVDDHDLMAEIDVQLSDSQRPRSHSITDQLVSVSAAVVTADNLLNDISFGESAISSESSKFCDLTADNGVSSLHDTPENTSLNSNSREPSIYSLDLKSRPTDDNEPHVSRAATVEAVPLGGVYDKYAAMRQEMCNGGDSSLCHAAEEHVEAWLRCVGAADQLVAESCALLGGASSSLVCQQLLATARGVSHVRAVTEAYRVVRRIRFFLKTTTLQSDRLVDLILEADNRWNDFLMFVADNKAARDATTSVEPPTSAADAATTAADACGVCLLPTAGEARVVEYAARKYHASCANLWLNRVDSLLPRLLPPALL